MRELHEVLAWVVIVTAGAVGAWITAAHFLVDLRQRWMWVAAHTVYGLTTIQVMVGVALTRTTDDVNDTHTFYGFLAFVTVGMIVGYRQLAAYRYLLYGLGSLFLMGLGIRLLTL